MRESLAVTEYLLREYVDLYHLTGDECKKVKDALQEAIRQRPHAPLFAEGAL